MLIPKHLDENPIEDADCGHNWLSENLGKNNVIIQHIYYWYFNGLLYFSLISQIITN